MSEQRSEEQLLKRVAEISARLADYYEPAMIPGWFFVTQSMLDDVRPIDLMRTDEGWLKVRAVVMRLSDGAYV